MGKKGWIIFIAIVVIVLGGLITWTRTANPPLDTSSVNPHTLIAASSKNGNIADHTRGQTDGKILFVEFGDFQCPSCGSANSNVNTLVKDYGDKVTFVFRNFPLTTIHANAKAAAAVAEAAGLQGQYWQMHDMLYDNQDSWSALNATERNNAFNGYAESLKLDMTKFNKDLSSAAVAQKITFDQSLGKDLGINATPTYYLNGKEISAESSNGLVQGDLTKIKAEIDAL